MSKFNRLFLIVDLIRSRPGIKASQLASEVGVSTRTIYRDILTLGSHFPVIYDGGYRMLPTAYLKTLNLTSTEYQVFRLGLSCPALSRPDLKQSTRSLRAKIDTVIDPQVKSTHQTSYLSCALKSASEPNSYKLQKAYSIIEKAITELVVVQLVFKSDRRDYTVVVSPYALIYYFRDWYLVGYQTGKSTPDAFPVSTIQQVSSLKQNFQKDENFDLAEFLTSRWGIRGGEGIVVKIRFKGEAAKTILEHRHHPKEGVIRVSDAEVLYSVTVQGAEEIMSWILGFGPEAEVLSPQSLKEQVKQRVSDLADIYLKSKEAEVTQDQFLRIR